MANGGWYGTKEEWDRIEHPLLSIDPIIDDFAQEFGLSVKRNHKDWPGRSMEWGSDVRCLIQLYRESGGENGFTLWICASEDRGSRRYLKKESLVKAQPVEVFKNTLGVQLREGRSKLLDWSENSECLEFVTTLG